MAESSLFSVTSVNLRAGQLAVDAEFVTTVAGALFLNGNYGAPHPPMPSIPVPPTIPTRRRRAAAFEYARRPVLLPGRRVLRQTPTPTATATPRPASTRAPPITTTVLRFPISGNQGLFSIYEIGLLCSIMARTTRVIPAPYRVGGFFDTDTFSDEHIDSRPPGADPWPTPFSTGVPRGHDG